MNKKLLPFMLLLLSAEVLAQSDSLSIVKLNTDLTIASRNIWRGLDYGSSPMIQGTLSARKNFLEVGAYGTTTLNGSKRGYGTWVELFATAYVNNWSFTIDDYFFFNELDGDNNYFDWNRSLTQHFIEGRVKYAVDKFSLMAGYAFYKNEADKTNGVYLEGEYFFLPDLSIIVAGLTSASSLSFYADGGITTIGIAGKREIAFSDRFSIDLKASLLANPSYEKSVNAPGVGTNPIYFVVSIAF